MKALACLFSAALVVGVALPASAGMRVGAAPHPGHGAGLSILHRGAGGFSRHGGGIELADRHPRRHFYGAGWFDGYALENPDEVQATPPDVQRHFYGASWIVPGTGAVAPETTPAAGAAPAVNSGPRIIYLKGEPAKNAKGVTVIYGTFK